MIGPFSRLTAEWKPDDINSGNSSLRFRVTDLCGDLLLSVVLSLQASIARP